MDIQVERSGHIGVPQNGTDRFVIAAALDATGSKRMPCGVKIHDKASDSKQVNIRRKPLGKDLQNGILS